MPLAFRETRGDLFSAPSDTSLAHCVSTDMQMSKGIAKLFRDKFGQVDELKNQSVFVIYFSLIFKSVYLYRCISWWLCLY